MGIGLGNEARARTRAAAPLGSVRLGLVWRELIGDEDRSNNREYDRLGPSLVSTETTAYK